MTGKSLLLLFIYGHSQSTGTKQNPDSKVLNTGFWESFDIAPSEIQCNDFQDIPGQKMSKDTTKKMKKQL